MKRLQRAAGSIIGSLSQLETLHIVSGESLRLAAKDRLHYGGSTRGDCIQGVEASSWECERETWQLTVAEKKNLFKEHRIAVGGANPAAADEEKHQRKRADTEREPVFFHAPPILLCEELLHDYNIAAVLDATAGSGRMAMTCIRRRIPYLGICLSAEHAAMLTKRLEYEVFSSMQVEDDELFCPALAVLLTGDKPKKTKGKGKAKAKAKADGEAKAKTKSAPRKKGKNSAEDDGDEDGDEDGEDEKDEEEDDDEDEEEETCLLYTSDAADE